MRIELIGALAVIAVMLLLLGITYRALIQARHREHLGICINNLRKLVQAVHMYENEWGTVPIEKYVKTEEGWCGFVQQMLFPYVHDASLFVCPAHRGGWFTSPTWKGREWQMSYAYFVNHYTVNKYGRGNPRLRPRSPLFRCRHHPHGIVIARYDGTIELAPFGRYRIIRAEFEVGSETDAEDE